MRHIRSIPLFNSCSDQFVAARTKETVEARLRSRHKIRQPLTPRLRRHEF